MGDSVTKNISKLFFESKLWSTANYPQFIDFNCGPVKQNEKLQDRPLRQHAEVNEGLPMF